ncbi:MAG: enoyl-CoA hydratase/isomerase family protein [bacterium]
MSDSDLLGVKDGPIFTITLNRPDKRNAIPFESLVTLCEMVEELAYDAEVRVIILKGEGKVFSSGVDFNSLGALVGRFMGESAGGGMSIRSDISKYQSYLTRLESIEIPIICAMHGAVYGMAWELALACDIRLMSDDCKWAFKELKFGLICDLGGQARLLNHTSPARVMEILATGRTYTARQALDWGLVNHLYQADQLMQEAESMARDIIRNAPIAVGGLKRITKKGQGMDLNSLLDMEGNLQSILLRSEDFQEGIAALMEQRDANWKRK